MQELLLAVARGLVEDKDAVKVTVASSILINFTKIWAVHSASSTAL